MRRSILLVVLLAGAARADQSPLLTRWAEAVGGAERLATVQAVHRLEAIDEDGMPGTREEWVTPALQRRERLDHEHDEAITLYDGVSGWRRDWNGFVESLAGADLRRQNDIALIHSFAAVAGAAGPPEAIGSDTLQFHARGGSAVRFVFDPATGLPLRAEMPSFDGTLTVAFSDWRSAGGILVPFVETWKTGPNTTVARLQSIELVPRDRLDLRPPQPGPDDAFFLRPGKSSERVSFNFDNNHIMILTMVNGVGPIWFLVDTGANYSIINASRVSELHLTPYGGLKTIGGGSSAASGAYVQHVTYRFGEVELRDQHAAVLELGGLEKLYGMPLGGILGFDFLSRFVTDIDYVSKTLTLHPRTFDSAGIRATTTVPLVMQGEQPYFGGSIEVSGETIPAWFILDVGAADTITFTTPFIAAHHLLERAGDRERTVHKFAAPGVEAFNPTNVRGLIDAVTIGNITLPHVLVNLSAATNGAYTSPAFDGNIGETILSRFAHVILDYRRRVMILQALPSTTKPFEERKTFGLNVIASPDLHHFTVTAVGDKSPAGAAGFRKGDVIVAADETAAAQMDLAALKRVLSAEGTRHRFLVQRGSEEITLQTTIDMIPISSLR